MTSQFHSILNRLSKSQQELLIYASRECICQHIIYEPGKYIGVYAEYNRRLVPEHEEGIWSIGTLESNK